MLSSLVHRVETIFGINKTEKATIKQGGQEEEEKKEDTCADLIMMLIVNKTHNL